MSCDKDIKNGRFQKLGLALAVLFYLVSCIAVYMNSSGGTIIDTDVKVITFAHWQLEDGFREGYAEAIREFEKIKAEQGVKVKVVQTTVPVRGYRQWFLTQLISGDPADVMELYCSSEIRNQYFTPLSEYVSQPNPFNKGTRFENVPWKDTYIDGMDNALDEAYAEYFGVGTYFHVYRLFVNLDLLEKATGSREMPETVDQWIEDCRKIKQYGKKIGEPVIPIGVRGFDKSTISYLLKYYFNQLNGNLAVDSIPVYGLNRVLRSSVLKGIADRKIDNDRLLAAVDIVKRLGQNFGEGFTATDLEQTKFLFFTGQVGFFPEGTWNAYSMVKNSPFEVGITTVPRVGKDSQYYKYFTGVPGEKAGSGGLFGIPKSCRNFDLSLEFLQFITSWRISQKVMIGYCKWPTPVKDSVYTGLMKHFKPNPGNGSLQIQLPFGTSNNCKSQTNILSGLEMIVLNNINDDKEYYWNNFLGQSYNMQQELSEVLISCIRKYHSMEELRMSLQLQYMVGPPENRDKIARREKMTLESVVYNMRQSDIEQISIDALGKIQKEFGDGN